jgi:hypothetical protein
MNNNTSTTAPTSARVLQVGDVVIAEASPYFIGIIDGREIDQVVGEMVVSVDYGVYGDLRVDGEYLASTVRLATAQDLADVSMHMRQCSGTCGRC